MGQREQATVKSDSGYGDDGASVTGSSGHGESHPLSRKGYNIGPASQLKVGDVFEFLWADASEYEWEWKCLGYSRFIVLRHSDNFPHHAACIPVSVGTKHDFAKPGMDHMQQGFVFANGETNPGYEQPDGGPKLAYSPIGVELCPGRLRVKEDSRANYADIVEIDHDAEVMVVGNVVAYFDRVRRNVNRAAMQQVLRKALEEYKSKAQRADAAGSIRGGHPGAGSRAHLPGIVPSEVGFATRDREGSVGSWEGTVDGDYFEDPPPTIAVQEAAPSDFFRERSSLSVDEQMARSGARRQADGIPRSEVSASTARRESRTSGRRESRTSLRDTLR